MLVHMAQQCAICGKTGTRVWRRVKLRGKYNPTVKRTQKPNLQWMSLSGEAAAKLGLVSRKRVKACTKCMKAAAKG